MPGELTSVLVRLTADATDFVDGIEKATKSLEDFMVVSAGIAGAGAAIAGALTLGTQTAASFESQIFDLHAQTGIATETLSAMAYAAQAQGLTIGALQAAFRRLSDEVQSAVNGYPQAVKVFENLGVSVKDTEGNVKTFGELVPEVSDGLQKFGNSIAGVALATDVWGRSAVQLGPILSQGSDTITDWGKAADAAGKMVTESQAEAGKAFTLTENLAYASLQGLAVQIGASLMPQIESFISGLMNAIVWVSNFAKEFPGLTRAIFDISLALIGTGGLLMALEAVSRALGVVALAFGTTALTVGGWAALIAIVAGAVFAFRNDIAALVIVIGSDLLHAFALALDAIAKIAGSFGMTGMQDRLISLRNELEQNSINTLRWAAAYQAADDAVTPINPLLQALIDNMQHTGQTFLAGVDHVDSFQKAVDNMVGSITGASREDQILEAALQKLTSAHADEDLVVEKLGKKIIEMTNALIASNTPLSENLQHWRDLAIAHENDIRELDNYIQMMKALQLAQDEAAKGLANISTQQSKDIDLLTKEWQNAHDTYIKMLNESMTSRQDEARVEIDAINNIIAADTTHVQKSADLTASMYAMKRKADEEYEAYYTALANLRIAEINQYDASVVASHADAAKQALQLAKQYFNEYEKLLSESGKENDSYWKNFYTDAQTAFENMEKSMASAMGGLVTGLADAIAKDLIEWKSWGDSLQKLATDVSENMLKAFLEGLMNPLTNMMKSLGKNIADALSGGSGGGGGIFGGGILNSILGLGGGIGGIALAGVGGLALGGLFGGGGGAPAAPAVSSTGNQILNGGYYVGGSYAPSPSANRPAPNINITVQGHIVGVDDLVGAIQNGLYQASRFDMAQLTGVQ
jgi:hypothetical protein